MGNRLAITATACMFVGAVVLWPWHPRPATAHCDTMDGPVVTAAKAALDAEDVTPVLKWVRPKDEGEIRSVFAQVLTVRKLGPEAGAVADRHFFETLVRLHRAGEGAPYTGLKPGGTALSPAVAAADAALESGNADELVKLVIEAAAAGIRQRFAHTVEARRHAEDSPEAGRQFVAAYVEFVHYGERLYADASGAAAHSAEPGADAAAPHHHE